MDLQVQGPVKTEPRMEMTTVVSTEHGIEGSDLSFERATDEMGLTEGSSGKKRKVFPHHITSVLRTLYKSGMIGVGIQYSTLIDTACERTGLSRAQVKSWIKRTKYHQKRVLRQEEDKDGDSYSVEPPPSMVLTNQTNATGLSYGENPSTSSMEESTPQHHHHRQQVYIRENMEPIIETNRLVIVDDDPPPTSLQPHPSRNDVIPALERHIISNDMKTMPTEHIKNYSHGGGGSSGSNIAGKRPKPVTMVTEDLNRVSRNEAILAAVSSVREQHKSPTDHPKAPPTHQQLYTTTPIPQHALQQVTQQHLPLQTAAILQPVALTSHAHISAAPPTLVMTNGTTAKVTQPVKETPAQEAARLFKKIERNFKRLDELGYQGFAFSIHGDDTQLVYSGPIGHCFTPPLLSYLRAVIIAANPPPLLPHINSTHLTAAANTVSQTSHVLQPQQSTSSSRQLYMYDTNPSRVQQRTAIYELSEADSVDENGDRDENEYETVPVDSFIGANGRAVHVVVTTQDPNYLDNGGMSD